MDRQKSFGDCRLRPGSGCQAASGKLANPMRAHVAALFVTFHVTCVLIYALPRPPVLDQDILEHPEVKAEMEQGFGALHKAIPWRDTPEQMRDDVLRGVLTYTRFTSRLRALVEPYLETAGSTQSWHMFG